jgi:hypothetical protein
MPVLVLVRRGWSETQRPLAAASSLCYIDPETFDSKSGKLRAKKLRVKTRIEHGRCNHVACGTSKAVEIRYPHYSASQDWDGSCNDYLHADVFIKNKAVSC